MSTTENTDSQLNTDALFFASLVTPAAVADGAERLDGSIEELAKEIGGNPNARVFFVGGGASLAAMMGAQYLLDRYTSVPSEAYTGWQFLSRDPYALGKDSYVFTVSYSGQTPEVNDAAELATERGARVIALTDTTETPLAGRSGLVLDYRSKAVYTAPLALIYRLAAHVMRARDENVETANQILAELDGLPALLEAHNEKTREPARDAAARFTEAGGFYVIASGPLFGLAFKLSLSVVVENLWIDAAPVDAGEFYHGPIEIIPTENAEEMHMPLMHLVGTDGTREVSQRAVKFGEQRGAPQIVFDAAEYPQFSELFSPFALFAPTEWMIMYMAAQKGHDVDERRYMGKIGKVWGDYGLAD